MKAFAQFYHESTGWNGKDFSGPVKLIPMPGTDGVFPLDGRKSVFNMVADAKRQADRLRNVRQGIKGVQIMRSVNGMFDGVPLTEVIPVSQAPKDEVVKS